MKLFLNIAISSPLIYPIFNKFNFFLYRIFDTGGNYKFYLQKLNSDNKTMLRRYF